MASGDFGRLREIDLRSDLVLQVFEAGSRSHVIRVLVEGALSFSSAEGIVRGGKENAGMSTVVESTLIAHETKATVSKSHSKQRNRSQGPVPEFQCLDKAAYSIELVPEIGQNLALPDGV